MVIGFKIYLVLSIKVSQVTAFITTKEYIMQYLNFIINILLLFGKKTFHFERKIPKDCLCKMPDQIALETYLLINVYFNKILPTIFKIQLTLATDNHGYDTRQSIQGVLLCLSVRLSYIKEVLSISAPFIQGNIYSNKMLIILFYQSLPNKLKYVIK